MKTIFTFCLSILFTVTSLFAQWVPLKNTTSGEVTIATETRPGSIVLTIDIPGFYKLQDNNGSYAIQLSDGVNQTEAGFPDVQHLAVSIQIPGTGTSTLKVLKAEYTEVSDMVIAPSKGDPQFSNLPGWHNPMPSSLAYANDMFYPLALAKAGDPYVLGGVRGQTLMVYPLKYHPLNHILRVCHHLELELQFSDETGINELAENSRTAKGSMAEYAVEHFVNGITNERYVPVAEGSGMLIVTPAAFVPLFDEFVQWKAQCGIKCTIITAEEAPEAGNIQQKVNELYYGAGLSYLLLAGDVAKVPSLTKSNGMGDNMYGFIEGNDHYPEIITGRMPAKDARELKIMLSRSLNYEKGLSGFEKTSVFAGIASELGPGDNGEKDFEHLRIIGQQLQQNCSMAVSEFFDGSQGGSDQPGNPVATEIEQAFNTGLGTAMYIGHGTSNGWFTSGFNSNNIKKLLNTDTWPVIWSAGCDNGNFKEANCFAANWLKAGTPEEPTGAVAAMMSTGRQSWFPPMAAQDEIAAILAGKKPGVTTRTFGGISMAACMRMNDKYGEGGFRVTDTWNLFGDPSLMMRNSPPQKIEAHHAEATGADASGFVVNVPVDNALASIVYQGKLLGAANAIDGMAIIPLQGIEQMDEVLLTITAYNHLPYTAIIRVVTSPAVASEPLPLNHSKKISAYTSLKWETAEGITPAFYEVFISNNPAGPWDHGMITFATEWQPDLPLQYLTNYYWKVISHHNNGSSQSAIFDFTTISKPDEDFEQAGFPRSNWMNSGDNQWYPDESDSFEGRYSLRSGNIDHSGSSLLAYECVTATCDLLSFRVKTSSQLNCDKLMLLIDNEVVDAWSGELPWTEAIYQIEPGAHRIEWVFSKDDTGSSGADAAWLDNIYLPEKKSLAVFTQDVAVCASTAINLDAAVEGQSHLVWKSQIGGQFEDAAAEQTIYYPTDAEIQAGEATVQLAVYQNDVCQPLYKEIRIQLHSLPELPAIRDTLIYANESLEFLLPQVNGSNYQLSSIGEITGSSLRIEDSMLKEGENNFTITVETEAGCADALSFTVTFIPENRPQQGDNLVIYPNPARDNITIANMQRSNESAVYEIYSITGQFIGRFSADIGSQLNVSAIPAGVYILKASDGNEVKHARFVKQI
jgi:gingipain R